MVNEDASARIMGSVGTRVTRRTVTRGIAWTTPVVAIATAAPAFAVSRVPPKFVYEAACKYPGGSCDKAKFGYALAFTVTNNDAREVAICGATLSIDNSPFAQGTKPIYNGGCFTIGGGKTGRAYFYFKGATNSANVDFSGTITISYANDCASCGSDSAALPPIPFQVTDTPPKGLCDCGAPFIAT